MKRKIMGIAGCIILTWGLLAHANQESDRLGRLGMDKVSQGHLADGLKLIRQAMDADKADFTWHMQYAQILLLEGQEVLRIGRKAEAMSIFKDAEYELMNTIRLSKENDWFLRSQCFLMLGDLNAHIYNQKDIAKRDYETALKFNSDNIQAKKALDQLK